MASKFVNPSLNAFDPAFIPKAAHSRPVPAPIRKSLNAAAPTFIPSSSSSANVTIRKRLSAGAAVFIPSSLASINRPLTAPAISRNSLNPAATAFVPSSRSIVNAILRTKSRPLLSPLAPTLVPISQTTHSISTGTLFTPGKVGSGARLPSISLRDSVRRAALRAHFDSISNPKTAPPPAPNLTPSSPPKAILGEGSLLLTAVSKPSTVFRPSQIFETWLSEIEDSKVRLGGDGWNAEQRAVAYGVVRRSFKELARQAGQAGEAGPQPWISTPW